jgi:gamma-glutamyltranspeptidase/glutathione hydrolase
VNARNGDCTDAQWSKSATLLKNASKGLGEGSYPFLIDGQTPRPGDLFSNPALGATLKSIGEKGAKAYYTGENAQAIVDGERAFWGAWPWVHRS